MIKTITYILIALLFIGIAGDLSARESVFENEIIALHPRAGLLSNNYTSNFSSFQGSVDCGIFTKGIAMGWSGGIFVEKDFDGLYQLGLGLFYADRSALSSINNTFESRDNSTGNISMVTLRNSLDAQISYVEINPEIRLLISNKFINGPLRISAGLRFGIPVSMNFTQEESIVSPENAVFINPDGRRTTIRDLASGEITNTSLQTGISAGIENLLNIGNGNFFTQQIIFDYNFNNIVKETDWTTYAVRLELGLRFSISQSDDVITVPETIIDEPEQKSPTIIVEEVPKPPQPYIELSTEIITESRIESGNELLATMPLVNSIFFENNSAEIPDYYKLINQPGMDLYNGNPVDFHRNIIPAICTILNNHPNSRILLEGATSGPEHEPKGLELSKARTDAVKQAFVDLGISPSRISFRALISPQYPSNQQYPEGVEENRRVDIWVTEAPLQQYVDIQNYREFNGKLVLNLQYGNFPPGTKAMIKINDEHRSASGPGIQQFTIKQRLNQGAEEFKIRTDVNVNGVEKSDDKIVNINELTNEVVDLSLKNFEAVLRFNYNSSDLTSENEALLKQLVQKLPDGSTILIIGSADTLGTAEHNRQLASDRAKKTEIFIKKIAGNRLNIETNTNIDKFSDETPQGRFLNRSIKIRVKK
ncbi:MAG: OmpA family protein [Candidatus Kapabacteria bacterium]|jgi:outer membrane protein OmpA-like peptidoglycan-associated protein|nr:OmpA family protein [Candidatus Kapabacteria bacterium]